MMTRLLMIVPFVLFSQKRMLLVPEIEYGKSTTSYESLQPNLEQSIISSENSNDVFKIGASMMFLLKQNWNVELGLSQTMKQWSLQGGFATNNLKITQRQFYPSFFVGGWKEIDLESNAVYLQLYFGSRLSLDFVNYNSLNDRSDIGGQTIITATAASDKIGVNIVPEIGLKGIFETEMYSWWLGLKYYLPLTSDAINGSLRYFSGNELVEQINYKNSGEVVALSLKIGIELSSNKR